MLNIKEFAEYCKENLVSVLPEADKNATISVNEVTKNNGKVLTALTVKPEGCNVAPNIYLDGFYMDYRHGKDLDAIMEEISNLYLENKNPSGDICDIGQKFKDINFVKERVIMVAINKKIMRTCFQMFLIQFVKTWH